MTCRARAAGSPRRAGAPGSHRRVGAVALFLVAAPVLAACSCRGESAPASGSDRRELTVFAASSLMEAFQDLAPRFEQRRSDVDVVLAFAGSQVLRLQIEHGARAHVFASADLGHVQALADAGLVTSPQVFATNELAVIVPSDNPARIESFGDLREAERLVVGAAAVPVGAYAREALARAGVHYGEAFAAEVLARVVSHEPSARLARARVEIGEADAAIVYRTDALAGGAAVRVLPLPSSLGVRAEYGIAAAAETATRADAEAWISFVLSPEGQGILARRGFGAAQPSTQDRPRDRGAVSP